MGKDAAFQGPGVQQGITTGEHHANTGMRLLSSGDEVLQLTDHAMSYTCLKASHRRLSEGRRILIGFNQR